jgi:hypothetical protein
LELQAGLHQPESYMAFASRAKAAMREFSAFVAGLRQAGRTLAAYGAAAKGNILLNSCGVQRADVICVADRCSAKQGKLLPGSHIPIVAPDVLIAVQPDDVVILPWNIADEVARELQPLRDRGTRLWIPLPHVLEYGRQSSRSLIPLHNADMVS